MLAKFKQSICEFPTVYCLIISWRYRAKNKLSFLCFRVTSQNIQLTHHYHTAHDAPCLSLKILHKHCFTFSWNDCNPQEKLEATVMVNKVYYGH